MNIIGYKKGGGSSHTPVEQTDNLHSTAYARVLDLVAEGEIKGFVDVSGPVPVEFRKIFAFAVVFKIIEHILICQVSSEYVGPYLVPYRYPEIVPNQHYPCNVQNYQLYPLKTFPAKVHHFLITS